MQPFTYSRPASLDEAFHMASLSGTALLAGGTTMVDLMRGDLAAPSSIVDIGHLSELAAFDTSGPVLRFGALARMADVAEDATLLRDYPALAESLPGYEIVSWSGLVAPAGTPAAVVDKLSAALQRALARADVQQRFASMAFEPAPGTVAAFRQRIQGDTARWARLVQQAGIQPE